MADFTISQEEKYGRIGVQFLSNGAFFYLLNGERVQWVHSAAEAEDGRRISTKTAKQRSVSIDPVSEGPMPGLEVVATYDENDLILRQHILLPENGDWISVQVVLSDVSGNVATRYIAPILTPYPDISGKPIFLSLDQKMLLVPYDNDMWVRYESVPLRPGRSSYDVTAIYDEQTRQGLVVGALDFDCWKNAIACSLCDARSITAYSGAADTATHDSIQHGCLSGSTVSSSRFVMLWTEDVRRGLEQYGDLCSKLNPPLPWNGRVPFGYNTFSGLGGHLTLDSWQAAGDLIDEMEHFCDNDGVTYINLDAAFHLDEDRLRVMIDAFHKRGQKVGTYSAPIVGHEMLGLDRPLDDDGNTMRDFLLRDSLGRPLPAPDSLLPLDCTHPLWEKYVRKQMRKVVEMGFDYLKIDFLSHGAMEGHFADPLIKTGRMALNRAYRIIHDELSKATREIFISLSIAPLFPCGYGHARRCCCDSFGHSEDVRYVLNALSFGWWESGRLYQYNDPDHIVLYRSVIDGRPPTLMEEARSRYNAAAISGTVMLLSDDFGPDGEREIALNSRKRALMLANNEKINALARVGKPFCPVELNNEETAVFTRNDGERWYAAVFNYTKNPVIVTVKSGRSGLPTSGHVMDLNRDTEWQYSDVLNVALAPFDSAILEIIH